MIAYYIIPELRRSIESVGRYLAADSGGKFAVVVGSTDEALLLRSGGLLADTRGQLLGSDPATVLSEVQSTVVAAAVASVTFAPVVDEVIADDAVDLTDSGSVYEVASVVLPAGTWDVDGFVGFLPDTATSVTGLSGGTNTTTATLVSGQGFTHRLAAVIPGANAIELPLARKRYALPSGGTVYLNASALFTVSTIGAYGRIQATKVIA